MPDIGNVFDRSSDELNLGFRTEAPKLAGKALSAALAQAGVKPGEVDALLISTCTGYLCPGLTSYVAEQLGLRQNAVLHDLVGLGCGAAIPTLRAAGHLLAAKRGPSSRALRSRSARRRSISTTTPGVIISACLFGDGTGGGGVALDPRPPRHPRLRL